MPKKLASYVQQLFFDPKLNDLFVAKYIRNPRLVILVVLLLVMMGTFSLLGLPRVLNPDIKIPIIIVTDVLPGASPSDVESLVTIPLENAVLGMTNVKTVDSSSQNSVASIQVEFNSGVDPDKARDDVRAAINQVTGLPSDAQTPSVIKVDFQHIPVWTFLVTTKADTGSLSRFSTILQDRIKDIKTVDSVSTSGLDTQEVQVIIKPTALSTYKVNPLQLSQTIQAAINSYPAGDVNTDKGTFSLTIDRSINTVQDIRNINIAVGTKSIPLSDIANIYERSKPGTYESYFTNNQTGATRAVTFSVYKTSSASIDQSVADIKQVVDQTVKQYDNMFTVSNSMNVADQIDLQFNDLYRDFSITVFLVFLVLFIFVGLRQAVVALFSTPLTFMVTFTIMKITGIPLSFIAVFALLLSLGLLVDDTIVIISAMTAYYRTGKFSPLETSLLVWRDFLTAITTTTITTVWAFLPLLLASGIIGDFIRTIPIVVSSTLLGSYIVALFVTMPVLIIVLKPSFPGRVKTAAKIASVVILLGILYSIIPKGQLLLLELVSIGLFLFVFVLTWRLIFQRSKMKVQNQTQNSTFAKQIPHYFDHGLIHFELVAAKYHAVMYRILQSAKIRRTILIMVIIFSLFAYILLPLGFVRNEFFPASDQDELFVSLEMPSGTNLNTTTQEGLKLLQQLRQTPGLAFVSMDVGSGGGSSNSGPSSSGSNIISYTLVLPPKNERLQGSIAMAQSLRSKLATYPAGVVKVAEESNGPPAGADVEIKLFGSDLNTLDTYANKIEDFLKKQPGLTNIDKSIKPGTSKIVFVPDNALLVQNHITIDQVGAYLRLFASGIKAKDVQLNGQTGTDKTDITIRTDSSIESAEDIAGITIPTQNGPALPLLSLGHLNLQVNPTTISREGGKRTISVTAAVTKGFSVSDANAKLLNYAQNGLDLPSGYSWATGGVNQQNQESVQSILEAMLLSFFLIIVTMVIQFQSFRKALIVMLVIPLSIAGVFIIFALTHTPLSFPALIGVLALFGIVVKNSILIVDKINQNYRIGMEHVEAIADAASSRLEPIALTSFATIIGLIPISLSDPLWRGLGGAIIAGLSFSGTIMLFFIPVVYYYWFRNDHSLER